MSHVSKKKDKKKRKAKRDEKEGEMGETESVKSKREREKVKQRKIFFLLSKIYGNRTVNFFRSKRKNRSMHRELRVGTKILEFHQTP